MTRSELQREHGTPQEFESAVNKAADHMFITTSEAVAAISKYQREWDSAAEDRYP